MPDLPLVELGSTHLRVSRVGLGFAALGRPGYINLGHADDLGADYSIEAMQHRANAVLDAAWNAGIRYFDAARSYGRAEEFLANWLRTRGIAPSTATVGSKWGYTYTADWQVNAAHHEIKDHTVATLQRQIGESQSLLGSYLALYQIHSATIESGVLDDAAVLSRLVQLRDTGLTIGLSVSGPRQADVIRRAIRATADGVRVFATVQATWNLIERSASDALAEAHAAGMGIIVKEALANGRLTARNRDFDATQRQMIAAVESTLRAPLDAITIAAALANPWAGVVLSGATRSEQLLSNLSALSVSWDPSIDARLLGLRESAAVYWHKRGLLPWN